MLHRRDKWKGLRINVEGGGGKELWHCEKFCTSLVKLSKKVRPIGFLLENFYLPLVKLSWICRLKELLTVSNFQYLN